MFVGVCCVSKNGGPLMVATEEIRTRLGKHNGSIWGYTCMWYDHKNRPCSYDFPTSALIFKTK